MLKLGIRWRKVVRDLWLNKNRTLVVVLSIAVGVFAVGTIASSQIILSRDLRTAYLATNPAHITILTFEAFDDEVVDAVKNKPAPILCRALSLKPRTFSAVG